jgi:hypothetical protein
VKTRDHHKGADFDAEEEAVRKFTQTRTMHIPKHDRKLVRILLWQLQLLRENASQGRDAWTRTNLERPRLRLAQLA